MSSSDSEKSYLAFELFIGTQTPAGYPITVIDAPAGDGESLCTLQVDAELQDALAMVHTDNTDEAFLVELGTFLFDHLFTNDVVTVYRTSLGMARDQHKGLRIRLRIGPPELAALPWEYLHDPKEDRFLATSLETALVRYIPVALPVRPTTISPPLRVLVVLANPSSMQTLDTDREKAILQEALAVWVQQGYVQIEIIERAVISEIGEAMRRFQPHVFHFVGHGMFDQATAYVVLEDEQGQATLVDERTFRELFNSCQETRLAVLNACQSATLSSSQPLVGLAPRLLQRQLSAVVAMQHPISDKAALIFTREFYRSLALGWPVEAAISEARKGIFLEAGSASSAWGTPVLFLRAKEGRLFQVEKSAAKALEIPPPPEPARPPEILGFVGRDAELTYFADKLETTHLTIIAGMAGVGKTALAAKLIEWIAPDRDRVFWHSFREGEGIDVILWRLAGFLAWHGRSDLWKLLQSTRLTGGKPPPSETLFDYVLQLSRGGNFLFCFDDFHHVDDDPVLNQLVERLRNALLTGNLSIILTSRRAPDFITLTEFNRLEGLSAADARQLLLIRGLRLTEAQSDELYKNTTGNAEFLTLAINVLQQARNPDVLISRLAESDDIERYLLQEVDETLTGQERGVMGAVAVLLGYPGTREVIDAVLNGTNVFRILRRLTERHLLMTQEGNGGRGYLQHAMVQSFYYEQTDRSERKRMHGRAGQFYHDEEKNLLQAGIHYERAGEIAEAARLVTQNMWSIINQGQIGQLRILLQRFCKEHLDIAHWIEVNLAKGQIYVFQAEGDLARDSLEIALNQIEFIKDKSQQCILSARACRGMGELMEERSPKDALVWMQKGLALLGGEDKQEEATLYIRSGTLCLFLNQYEEAQAFSQRGQALLRPEPSQWRSIVLRDLSGIYYQLGEIERAKAFANQAIQICRQLNDQVSAITPMMNLAICKFTLGDTQSGLEEFNTALAMARQIGNINLQTQIELNLGTALLMAGNTEQAKRHLQTSLTLAQEQRNQLNRLYALRNLIELHVDLREWHVVTQYLVEAESLALEIGDRHNLMTFFGNWCEVKLAEGDALAALDFAQRRLELATELEEIVSQGVSLAYLGKTLTALGRFGEAFRTFAKSLTLIGDGNPLQAALVRKDWGKALLAAKRLDEGVEMLAEARKQLREFEVLREVEEIDALLVVHDRNVNAQSKEGVIQ